MHILSTDSAPAPSADHWYASHRAQRWLWVTGLALLAVVLRTGSLEHEVIDWDESTFVLMAADILRGHLPYVQMFDMKPPGIFLLLAGSIGALGPSLWAVRLVGDLSVIITAWLTFAMVARCTSLLTAGLSAMVLIAMTAVPYGLHSSSELPAMAFLTAALSMATSRPNRLVAPFAAGLLASGALLTRTNLGIPVLLMGVVYLWPLLRPRPHTHRWSAVGFAAAVLAPLAALFAIYGAAGQFDVAVLSMITVPLAYVQRASWLTTLKHHLWALHGLLRDVPQTFLAPALLGGAAGGSIAWYGIRPVFPWRPSALSTPPGDIPMSLFLIGAALVGTAVSILRGGVVYLHYWLQLYPFAALAIALGMALAPRPAVRQLMWAGCLFLTAHAVSDRWSSFWRVASSPRTLTQQYALRRLAGRLALDRRAGDEIWALKNHLVLWYLDVPPITRIATHPAALVAPFIVTPLARAGYTEPDIFDRVVARRPRHIVSGDNNSFGRMNARQRALLNRVLADDYDIWIREPNITVYRRRGPL